VLARSFLSPLGYAHRSDLLEAGWRPDRLRRAIAEEGLLVRRRRWILDPTAPEAIRLAAETGGRVACVTAGELHGAWQLGRSAVPHLRLGPHQSDVCGDAVVHRTLDLVPASPRSLVEPVVNALSQVAACLPHDDAAIVWESALNRGLVHREELAGVRWRGERATTLARECSSASDSGLETRFVIGMRREGIGVRQQVWIRGRPVDGLIGNRLVVQIDGYAFHSDARQRRADIAHDRALQLAGYTVLRFDYHQIVHQWPSVVVEVRRALAQHLHLA
jgi:very-short-patch-repair endonuclease